MISKNLIPKGMDFSVVFFFLPNLLNSRSTKLSKVPLEHGHYSTHHKSNGAGNHLLISAGKAALYFLQTFKKDLLAFCTVV